MAIEDMDSHGTREDDTNAGLLKENYLLADQLAILASVEVQYDKIIGVDSTVTQNVLNIHLLSQISQKELLAQVIYEVCWPY